MNPCSGERPRTASRCQDGLLLEPDRGGDDILGLLGGDDETDGVPLAANDIALGAQPHLGLDLGPRRGRGGGLGVDDGGADERQAARAMKIGVFMAQV